MARCVLLILMAAAIGGAAPADPPATRPADETVDWLLGQATTAPAAQEPASRPTAVFEEKPDARSRKGKITLSNGERIGGMLSTTPDKPLRVWDEKEKEYRDIPFELVKTIEARVLWERDEREWHFRDSGSDIKEYTGKTYPARELVYAITLVNGQAATGGVVAPIFVRGGEQAATHVLYKRQKGEAGQTLKELVYVKRVEVE